LFKTIENGHFNTFTDNFEAHIHSLSLQFAHTRVVIDEHMYKRVVHQGTSINESKIIYSPMGVTERVMIVERR